MNTIRKACLLGLVSLLILVSGIAAEPWQRWVIETVDAPRLTEFPTSSILKLQNNQPRVVFGADHLYYATSANNGIDWTITVVDDSTEVGDYASLALDASGNPHISYEDAFNYALKYAGKDPNDPSSWKVTTIGIPGSGRVFPTAIAVGPDGQPHIAYRLESDLWNAWRECSGTAPTIICTWYNEKIDDASAFKVSIAVDSSHHAHIAYYNDNSASLYYAVQVGSGGSCTNPKWDCNYVDGSGSPGYRGSRGVSIALTAAGLPRIAYQDVTTGPKFAWYDTSWHTMDVLASPKAYSGNSPSLVLTAAGLPRILYIYDNEDYVYLSSGDAVTSPTFSTEVVIGDLFSIVTTSLALTSSGDPCALYFQRYLVGQIRYTCKSGSSWPAASLISDIQKVGYYSSLQLDKHGQPVIAYQDDLRQYLKYAQPASSAQDCGATTAPWKCETVSADRDGTWLSMALHPSGDIPYISHVTTRNNNELLLSNYVGSGGSCPGNAAWDCTYIDKGSYWPGGSTSLAMDASGTGRIAYFDLFDDPYDLHLATYVGSGGNCTGNTEWNCQVVDGNLGGEGGYVSLVLDSGGHAMISYADAEKLQLKLAFQVPSGGSGCSTASSTWNCMVIASFVHSPYVINSLALASDTDARISLYDPDNGGVYYASVNLPTKTVSIEEVDPDGIYDNSIAVYKEIPYIAYQQHDNGLWFARRVGGGIGNCGTANNWRCEAVDATGDTGEWPSLKIRSDGVAFISYYDRSMGDLKLARMVILSFLPMIGR
jgi:hypothetical protein